MLQNLFRKKTSVTAPDDDQAEELLTLADLAGGERAVQVLEQAAARLVADQSSPRGRALDTASVQAQAVWEALTALRLGSPPKPVPVPEPVLPDCPPWALPNSGVALSPDDLNWTRKKLVTELKWSWHQALNTPGQDARRAWAEKLPWEQFRAAQRLEASRKEEAKKAKEPPGMGAQERANLERMNAQRHDAHWRAVPK